MPIHYALVSLITMYIYILLQAELLEDFLTPMLDFVPSKRATAGQCLSHPWLQKGEKEDIAPN